MAKTNKSCRLKRCLRVRARAESDKVVFTFILHSSFVLLVSFPCAGHFLALFRWAIGVLDQLDMDVFVFFLSRVRLN